MPLRTSQRLPRAPVSYRTEIGRHMKLLLTGGAIAVAFAALTATGILWGPIVVPGPKGVPLVEFTPSPWLVAILVLAVFSWVQYRVWAATRDQVQALIAALYQHHPIDGEGIDIQQVRINTGSPGMRARPYLEATMVLACHGADEILVTCDGPLERANLRYPLPMDERKEGDFALGTVPVTHGIRYATMIAPNSFRVQAPPVQSPTPAFLEVHAEHLPAIVCVEWLA